MIGSIYNVERMNEEQVISFMKKRFETVNATIAFLKENKIQERVIENFSEIRERIEKAAKECASGKREAYEARLEHCGDCPFKKGCVKINAGIC